MIGFDSVIGFAGLLLADIPDGLGTIIMVAIFIIMGMVGQLGNKGREAQKRRQQGGRPQPNPPQRPQAQAGKPNAPAGQGRLQDEVATFLRGARKHQGQAKPEPPRVAARAEPVEVEVVITPGESVGGHVDRHLGSEKLGNLQPSLGNDLSQTDERMEDRVHEVFDHRLGDLASSTETAATAQQRAAEGQALPSTAAAGLAAMFANPDNIRQAIVISEIINRPEHRW